MFRLFIATPEKVFFDNSIRSVIAPGSVGYLEILTDHAPLITTLTEGEVTITGENEKRSIYIVSGGYLEVSHNLVTMLVDTIEPASEEALEELHARFNLSLDGV